MEESEELVKTEELKMLMTLRDRLAYWINEREKMRVRREQADPSDPGPFHDDPAMAVPRYCNVRREDDRVTRWIAKNWRNPNADHPNLILGMVLARMVNWPDSLAEIGFPSDFRPEDVKAVLRRRASRGEKVWTSAYTISTCGRSMAKEDYVVDHVLAQVDRRVKNKLLDVPPITAKPHLKFTFESLTQVDGLGSFLAAQVVADLKNTPGHYLENAADWWSWCAPGPGSLRGLAWYFRMNDELIRPKHFHSEILDCYEEVEPLISVKLHMQDFQNCLCEFSKYMRVSSGDGRVRNKYRRG